MKKYFILLSLVLLCHALCAQNAKRFWSDGPLTMTDFPQTGEAAHMEWYLGYTKVTEKSGTIHYTYYKAVAYMLPFSSSIASDDDLPQMQALFDRLEVHRRELQQQLNEAESKEEFEGLLIAARTRMNNDEKLLHKVSIGPMLEISPIPIFVDQGFRFGVSVCNPLTIPVGNLSQLLGPSTGVLPAIEIGWGRIHIMTDIYLTWGSIKGTAGTAPHRLLQGNHYQIIDASFYYGHTVYENYHLRLMPYLGAGLGILSSNSATDTVNYLGFCPLVGLTADIPFYTHVITQSGNSGLFKFLNSNHSLYSIRAQIFLRRDQWVKLSGGWVVGFSLGVSYLGRNTRPARNQ